MRNHHHGRAFFASICVLTFLQMMPTTALSTPQFGETTQYFPHFASGGGWVTSFAIHNTTSASITVQAQLFRSDGFLFTSQDVVVAGGGSQTLIIDSPAVLTTGWAQLTSSGRFSASELFQFVDAGQLLSQVGVLPSATANQFKLFGRVQTQTLSGTGIAIANPSPTTASVLTVRRFNSSGQLLETRNVELGPRVHLARFLHEEPYFLGLDNFDGIVEVSATQPVSAVTLRLDGAEIAAVGVITPQSALLTDGSVTNVHLADGAVTTNKLANGAVTSVKLGPNSVTTETIAPGAVTAVDIQDFAVTTAKLLDGATTTVKIADGTITNADVSTSAAIDPVKIAGTAATLGGNSFTGTQTIATGNLNIMDGNLSFGIPILDAFATNLFLGFFAGNSSMSGGRNVATGTNGLRFNSTGFDNTATGVSVLQSNTTGFNNTGTGSGALASNTTGTQNTAIGTVALDSNTTGSRNTVVGAGALNFNTTGSENTIVGHLAGVTATPANASTIGSNNTFIGYNSGAGTATQINNATAIGSEALVSASNALVLGNSNASVGIGTSAPVDKLDVIGNIRIGTGTNGCVRDRDATVIAGTCSSDARLKRNIEPFAPVLTKLVNIQPVTFDWRTEQFPERHFGKSRSFGLIAQDVEQLFPDLVTEDEQGFKAVRYNQLPFLMLQAIRELKTENDDLRSEVRELRDVVELLLRK